jgi:cyanate permease
VLGGRAAAGGVAIIVVLGGIGASLGPAITGWMRDLTNSYNAGLYLISGLAVLGAGLCLSMKDKRPT